MATAKYEGAIAMLDSKCKKITEILNSEAYGRYTKLKEYVESGQCKNDITIVKNQKFKNSSEYILEKNLNSLKASKNVKKYLATGENKDSFEVAEFLKVKKQVESAEFQQKKAYLCDKDKHKKCNAAKLLDEFNFLKNSNDIKSLPALQKSCEKYIAENSKWQSTFSDDFTQVTLGEKWITKPAAAQSHLQKSYSQYGDQQFTTDGKNLSLRNSVLQIITKNEKAEGTAWNEQHGFIPKMFSYTSGIISTATKFSQSQGKIEAKIKVPKTQGTYHAFWLGGNQVLPFVNIFCVNSGKLQVGAFTGSQSVVKKLPIPLKDDFYVVGIEWNEMEIVWKINGKIVFTGRISINESMYPAFSSGVKKEGTAELPISFDIDWIKCYKRK